VETRLVVDNEYDIEVFFEGTKTKVLKSLDSPVQVGEVQPNLPIIQCEIR